VRVLALSLNPLPGSARGLRADFLRGAALLFHGHLVCRGFLLRQFFLRGCFLSQLLPYRLLRRLLRGSFLHFWLLLSGFLGGHRRSLPLADGCSLALGRAFRATSAKFVAPTRRAELLLVRRMPDA